MPLLIELDKKSVERLIDLLFKERSLWDKEFKTYRVPGEIKQAYQRISDSMAMGGLDAKRVSTVIKNIRMDYLKELKKISVAADKIMMLTTMAKVHGVVKPTPPMYVPTVWWFPMLEAMFEDKAIKCMNTAAYSTATTTSYRTALNTMVISLRRIIKIALRGEKYTNRIEQPRGQLPTGRNDGQTAGWK